MFCSNCGKEITDENFEFCPDCGYKIQNDNEISCGKNWLHALILNWFLGCLGMHRFYTGYIGIGIAQFLTGGGLGIWSLVDMVMIGLNKYKNYEGQELEGYNKPIGYMGIAYALMVVLLVILIILLVLLAAALAVMKYAG